MKDNSFRTILKPPTSVPARRSVQFDVQADDDVIVKTRVSIREILVEKVERQVIGGKDEHESEDESESIRGKGFVAYCTHLVLKRDFLLFGFPFFSSPPFMSSVCALFSSRFPVS